jgi:hypothetical protein
MFLQRRLQTAQTAKQTIRNKAKPSSLRRWFHKIQLRRFLAFVPSCFCSNKQDDGHRDGVGRGGGNGILFPPVKVMRPYEPKTDMAASAT